MTNQGAPLTNLMLCPLSSILQVLRQLVMNKCGLRRVPAGLTQLTALSCADLRLNPELLLTLTEGKWGAAHGLITDSWD